MILLKRRNSQHIAAHNHPNNPRQWKKEKTSLLYCTELCDILNVCHVLLWHIVDMPYHKFSAYAVPICTTIIWMLTFLLHFWWCYCCWLYVWYCSIAYAVLLLLWSCYCSCSWWYVTTFGMLMMFHMWLLTISSS